MYANQNHFFLSIDLNWLRQQGLMVLTNYTPTSHVPGRENTHLHRETSSQ